MFNILLIVAAEINRIKLVNKLLTIGADVNYKIYPEGTALIIAAGYGYLEMVTLLLENRAEVNLENDNGETALIYAARNGHVEVVRLLIENGAYVNHREKSGITALIYAARNGHVEVIRLLIENGADVDRQGNLKDTAIIYAAANGHLEIVKLLIKSWATVNHQDKSGGTALIHAAINGHSEVVRLLIRNRAKVNHQKKSGETALIHAARNGHFEVVRLLIENGAKVNHQEKNGETALICAAKNGHSEVVKLLLKNEAKNFSLNFFLKQNCTEMSQFIIKHTLLIDFKIDLKEQLSDFPELIQYWKACREELKKLVTRKDPVTLHSLLATPKVLNPRNAKRFLRAYNNQLIDSSNFPIYQSNFQETIEYLDKNSYEIKSHEIIKKIKLTPKSLSLKTSPVLFSEIIEHLNDFIDHKTRNNLLVAAINANNSDPQHPVSKGCPQHRVNTGWFQKKFQVVREALGLTRN